MSRTTKFSVGQVWMGESVERGPFRITILGPADEDYPGSKTHKRCLFEYLDPYWSMRCPNNETSFSHAHIKRRAKHVEAVKCNACAEGPNLVMPERLDSFHTCMKKEDVK